MLDFAFARGFRHIDTAAAYSCGVSETIVGEWLDAHRADRAGLTVATKLLPPFVPEQIEARVIESLARLRSGHVDLLYLHQWHESALNRDTLAALDAIVRTGRVRGLGVSNFSAEQLAWMLAGQREIGAMPVRVLQNIHNLAVSGFGPDVRALCRSAGVGLVGYSPLGAGFLTGKHADRVEPGSRFEIVPGHQGIYFNDAARARLGRLTAVAARTGLPGTLLALAWAFHDSQVKTVLVGGRNAGQIAQALEAHSFFDAEIFSKLASEAP